MLNFEWKESDNECELESSFSFGMSAVIYQIFIQGLQSDHPRANCHRHFHYWKLSSYSTHARSQSENAKSNRSAALLNVSYATWCRLVKRLPTHDGCLLELLLNNADPARTGLFRCRLVRDLHRVTLDATAATCARLKNNAGAAEESGTKATRRANGLRRRQQRHMAN